MIKSLLSFLLAVLFTHSSLSQHETAGKIPNEHIKGLVSKYKEDSRGPYKILNWYCKDGRINPANEPCGDNVGGVQRATYKDEVVRLGKDHNIFLGQILATTDFAEFWDEAHYFSRMKQYLLEKYLQAVDNGWINRKAQYYRGAIQAEDEEAWGVDFFNWLLKDDSRLEKHFFLIREGAKNIPHSGDGNTAQKMRTESKIIAEEYPKFNWLRIKIHGQPEPTDIDKVRQFKKEHSGSLSTALNKKFDQLVITMQDYFKPIDAARYTALLKPVQNDEIKQKLLSFLQGYNGLSLKEQLSDCAEAMWFIRYNILKEASSKGRLALLDLSINIEHLIKSNIYKYENNNLKSLLDGICFLSTASAASGYTEIWEWDQLVGKLAIGDKSAMALGELNDLMLAARHQLEWGAGKNKAVFNDVVELYYGFEPLAHGFLDDKIRGSVMLELGNSIGELGKMIEKESGLTNKVLDLKNQSHVHGLNPGYAKGKLVVIEGNPNNLSVNPNDIYVFEQAPSDLKPVSGILTVSEGNLVSHVQLLARNLGIPNTAISKDNLLDLKKHNGEDIFYAVSNKGTVIIKPARNMSAQEKELLRGAEVKQNDMITINTVPIKLDVNRVLDLREVDASFSGIYCGPKAANMGELKKLFPDHVVEGMVIPFGVFLDHMKQPIPGQSMTYWQFLNSIFTTANQKSAAGASPQAVETYELEELKKLRSYIMDMTLKPSFVNELDESFTKLLGAPLGKVGVFLRSDTNMEDLKNFTGAGLNLTLFNVRERNKILEGIKKVWASPYEERSFRWRQKYLTNPESVFPSILVIPGVSNDCSGVMITKGVQSGNDNEITTAFSRGVGGAVDGQVAETWSLKGNYLTDLIAPSRESINKFLSNNEGLVYRQSSFEVPILSRTMRQDLFSFSQHLINKMGQQGKSGPYDVELGFKGDKIWLFQIRPFVENANAKSSVYLQSISPIIDMNKTITLNKTL